MSEQFNSVTDKELVRLSDQLSQVDPKSKEYGEIAENLLKVMKFKTDDYKLFCDLDSRYREVEALETNMELKSKELELREKEQRKEKLMDIIRVASSTSLTVIQIAFLGYWLKNTFEFEKEGTITTSAGRNLFMQLFKMK